MNERIRELQKQAFDFVAKQNRCKKEYFWENIRHNRELQDSVDAKFAELIVGECCFVGEQYADGLFDSKHYAFVNKKVKEHFGVEEK